MKGIHGKEFVTERRFEVRFREIMADARIRPSIFQGIVERLDAFVEPFINSLHGIAQREHAKHYVAGLCSGLQRKNMEMIAYLHDQDRQPIQKFIGQAPWDHRPMIGELVRQVGAALGETDGVLVFDPSAFLKQGRNSVGVARQWCGRLGKTDNCQVGIYLAMLRGRNTPWWIFACLCRRNGRMTGCGARSAAFPRGQNIARGMH